MIEKLWPGIPSPQSGRIIVPFFGTGVDSGYFRSQGLEVIGSDAQTTLIGLHKDFPACVNRAKAWIDGIRHLELEAQKTEFYALRAQHNRSPEPWSLYALCLCAHSQLIRHNRSGEYNAPFGKLRNPATEQRAAQHLDFVRSLVLLEARSFEAAMERAEDGDVFYLDPPYYGTFNGYTGAKFPHLRLLDEIAKAKNRGIHGAMSNSPSIVPMVQDMQDLADVDVFEFSRAGTVSSAFDKRGPVAEVLIVW